MMSSSSERWLGERRQRREEMRDVEEENVYCPIYVVVCSREMKRDEKRDVEEER